MVIEESFDYYGEFFFFFCVCLVFRASLVTQTVKNPPAVQETWVPSLVWNDPLEEGTATHSYSCLENPNGQRSLEAIIHGIKNRHKLSN